MMYQTVFLFSLYSRFLGMADTDKSEADSQTHEYQRVASPFAEDTADIAMCALSTAKLLVNHFSLRL